MKKYLLALVLAGFYQLAVSADFKEGEAYVAVEPAPPVGNGETVEVLEFFWYGCPHCEKLEPFMQKWLAGKPENVKFTRVPAMFGGAANMHAGAFYALAIMGEGERMHNKLFEEMHVKKNKMRTRDELEAFLEKETVDMDKFRAAMSSFTVQTKVKRAAALMSRYDIKGVPSIVVDARYRNKSLSSYEEFSELADFLTAKVLTERKGASAGSK